MMGLAAMRESSPRDHRQPRERLIAILTNNFACVTVAGRRRSSSPPFIGALVPPRWRVVSALAVVGVAVLGLS